MARIGLGPGWECRFANDFDPKKAAAYRNNFGGAPELKVCDVADVKTDNLDGQADLVWASFPCQDLSLAGNGAGLRGDRSGAFWPFWHLMLQLKAEGRPPRVVALENVCGALTSHSGHDFAAIGNALSQARYNFGALVLDAALFVPQSRPRLFIIGVLDDAKIPVRLVSNSPDPLLQPRSLVNAFEALSTGDARKWVWWRLPLPQAHKIRFSDLIEEQPHDVPWADLEETRRILAMMSPVNLAKVHRAQLAGRRMIGAIYKRTRLDERGRKVQRAEIRFDDFSGCLRTPGGGSSRQRILVVDGNKIRLRLLSSREAARLMGLPDTYILPQKYNDAYHLAGDGLVVPAVNWLAEHLLRPLALSKKRDFERIAA